MKRREFITLLGGAAAAWPVVARAQQPTGLRRIGVLMTLTRDNVEGQARFNSLVQGLEALGWIDGATCILMPAGRGTTSTAYALM